MTEDTTDEVSISRIEIGDVITVPGVAWLYLTDATTGKRLCRHVALPEDG